MRNKQACGWLLAVLIIALLVVQGALAQSRGDPQASEALLAIRPFFDVNIDPNQATCDLRTWHDTVCEGYFPWNLISCRPTVGQAIDVGYFSPATLDLSGCRSQYAAPVTLPPSMAALSWLVSLRAASVPLAGTLPDFISALTSLTELDLSNTGIGGTLPPSWSQLVQLNQLKLHGNDITGTLPPEWSTLTNLRVLSFSNNQYLWGPIPPEWELPRRTAPANGPYVPLNMAESLDRYGMKLDGTGVCGPWVNLPVMARDSKTFPDAQSGMVQTWCDDVPAKRILVTALRPLLDRTGPMGLRSVCDLSSWDPSTPMCIRPQPNTWVWTFCTPTYRGQTEFRSLTMLDGGNCNAGALGPLAWESVISPLTAVPTLILLRLPYVGLAGSIGTDLVRLSGLQSLDLSNNALTGALPSWMTLLQRLKDVNLASNDLAGPLPAYWPAGLPQLEKLDLFDQERFISSLPDSWSAFVSLQVLHVGSPGLYGTLPPSWSSMAGLRELWVQGPGIVGALPDAWLQLRPIPSLSSSSSSMQLVGMVSLQSLRIMGTRVTGSLPPAWGTSPALHDINLSGNRELVATLPPQWWQLRGVERLSFFGCRWLFGALPLEWGALGDTLLAGQLDLRDTSVCADAVPQTLLSKLAAPLLPCTPGGQQPSPPPPPPPPPPRRAGKSWPPPAPKRSILLAPPEEGGGGGGDHQPPPMQYEPPDTTTAWEPPETIDVGGKHSPPPPRRHHRSPRPKRGDGVHRRHSPPPPPRQRSTLQSPPPPRTIIAFTRSPSPPPPKTRPPPPKARPPPPSPVRLKPPPPPPPQMPAIRPPPPSSKPPRPPPPAPPRRPAVRPPPPSPPPPKRPAMRPPPPPPPKRPAMRPPPPPPPVPSPPPPPPPRKPPPSPRPPSPPPPRKPVTHPPPPSPKHPRRPALRPPPPSPKPPKSPPPPSPPPPRKPPPPPPPSPPPPRKSPPPPPPPSPLPPRPIVRRPPPPYIRPPLPPPRPPIHWPVDPVPPISVRTPPPPPPSTTSPPVNMNPTIIDHYIVWRSPQFCRAASSDMRYELFDLPLLSLYPEGVTRLLFDFDRSVAPGAAVALFAGFGGAGASRIMQAAAAGGYNADSDQLAQHGVDTGALPRRAMESMSVCCNRATGALAQLNLTFMDGTTSSAGACNPATSSSQGSALVPSGMVLAGVFGSYGRQLGALGLIFVRDISGGAAARPASKPPPPPPPPRPPRPPPQQFLRPGSSGLLSFPPSPPPPSPLPPPPPPPPFDAPSRPPRPPPSPSDSELHQPSAASTFSSDNAAFTNGGITQVANRYPASTLVLLRQATPIARNSRGHSVIASARYYKGRLAVFGGWRMITRCCVPQGGVVADGDAGSLALPPSDPAFDKLIENVVVWASYYGMKQYRAVLRVESPFFLNMARYVVGQHPTLFKQPAGFGASFLLPLDVFLRGGHENADVYVLGSYSSAYGTPAVQQRLREYVAMGKGLVVVGPDLMPSVFYRDAVGNPMQSLSLPDSQAVASRSAGVSGQAAAAGGDESDMAGASGSRGLPARLGGRTLLQASLSPAFAADTIPINIVTGPMGIVLTGLVSDPGGNLTVSGLTADSAQLQNSELAARQYLAYLQGQAVLSPSELQIVIQQRTKARSLLSRDTPGADTLWSYIDQGDLLSEQHLGGGATAGGAGLELQHTPPPPARTASARPPPPNTVGDGGVGTQASPPSGVTYVGCYVDSDTDRALPLHLRTTGRGGAGALDSAASSDAGDRRNTIQRCADLAITANLEAEAGDAHIVYVGMQGFMCFGGTSLDRHEDLGRLPDSACSTPCPGNPQLRCGASAASGGDMLASSVYRIDHP